MRTFFNTTVNCYFNAAFFPAEKPVHRYIIKKTDKKITNTLEEM